MFNVNVTTFSAVFHVIVNFTIFSLVIPVNVNVSTILEGDLYDSKCNYFLVRWYMRLSM